MTEIIVTAQDSDIVIIAYGASLFPREADPSQVFAALVKSLDVNVITVVKTSHLWRSLAWPDPTEPPFFNAVLLIRTPLPPPQLLAHLHELEARAGRVRTVANAPRTLDLDLIAYGNEASQSTPILPHPRAHERAFVMGPLSEIWPDWVHPVLGQTAQELYHRASVGCDASPFAAPPDLASK